MVLLIVPVDPLPKAKNGLKSLCRLEIQLDKACLQHDMAYGKSKDLTKKTQSGKVLRDKKIRWLSKKISFNGLHVF